MADKFCCLCESSVEGFLPWEGDSTLPFLAELECIGSDTKNFYCPSCRSTDRDRHLWLYINKLGLYNELDSSTRIMHVAPEIPIITRLLRKSSNVKAGDLFPEKYQNEMFNVNKVDLTAIDAADNSFDIFIANHILEHIVDYKRALEEIHRVLCNNGIAILQTPYSPIIYNNFEDPLINTDEARQRYYGQNNHVRLFGKILFDDIKSSGFTVHLVEHNDVLQEFNYAVYGVNPKESLILAVNEK